MRACYICYILCYGSPFVSVSSLNEIIIATKKEHIPSGSDSSCDREATSDPKLGLQLHETANI